jgi:hypothetical protein
MGILECRIFHIQKNACEQEQSVIVLKQSSLPACVCCLLRINTVAQFKHAEHYEYRAKKGSFFF